MLLFSTGLSYPLLFSFIFLYDYRTAIICLFFNGILLNGALAFIVSYFPLRKVLGKNEFREHLFIGVILLMLSVIMGLWARTVFSYINSLGNTPADLINNAQTISVLQSLLGFQISFFYPIILNLILYLICGFYQLISASYSSCNYH